MSGVCISTRSTRCGSTACGLAPAATAATRVGGQNAPAPCQRAQRVPAQALSAALYARFDSRGRAANKLLSAMRLGFGGRIERGARERPQAP